MVDIGSEYHARLSDRVVAYLIDLVLASVIGAVIALIVAVPVGLATDDPSGFSMVMYSIVFFLVVGVYFAYLDSSDAQATYGKRLAKIVVTDREGSRISLGRAVLRAPFKILFGSGLLGLVNLIVIAFTAEKRGIHDYIAGTLVLNQAYLAARRENPIQEKENLIR